MVARRPAVIAIAIIVGMLLALSYNSRGEGRQPTVYAPTPTDAFTSAAGTMAPPPRPTPTAGLPASSRLWLDEELASPTPRPTPTATRKPRPKPRATARPRARATAPHTSHRISGKASWYCKAGVSVCHHSYPPGSMVAAACGKLRAAMGDDWRGQSVTVTANGRLITVKLVDWCGSKDKLIDLYWEPMRQLGGSGVLPVTVRW